jgi:hypothetical protein
LADGHVDAIRRLDAAGHRGTLDFWGEHRRDLSTTAQYAAWRQLAEARGVDTNLQYRMTRSLLPEVIYAAGGVERELGQLCTAPADVQQFADESLAQHPRSPEEWPTSGLRIAAPLMREASYIFTNLLSWARSTLDRTERGDRHGDVREPAGLLPALAPGPLHDSVEVALRNLRASLPDYRLLVNYSLHPGAVTGGGSATAELLPAGRVVARVPDPLTVRILTWEVFEFTQDRDMLTYATEVMESIAIFVDKVIGAFEANRPARVGGPPPTRAEG